MRYPALLTALYELTMLAGYLEEGMTEKRAVFDLFFRTNPYHSGGKGQPGYIILADHSPRPRPQRCPPAGCPTWRTPPRFESPDCTLRRFGTIILPS